jgi:hypothetical protein
MAFYDEVHSTKKQRLGTRRRDVAGNEYVYLTGVGSTVAGDVVAYDEEYITTRLLQATIGQIGVAKAAIDATTKFGWYQIYGKATSVKVLSGFAADQAGTFSTSTAGSVDDAGAGGEEFIFGMLGRSAIASGTATMQLNYPWKGAATLD